MWSSSLFSTRSPSLCEGLHYAKYFTLRNTSPGGVFHLLQALFTSTSLCGPLSMTT